MGKINSTKDFSFVAPNHLRGIFNGQNHLAITPGWLQNAAFFCLCIYVYAWYLFNDFAGPFSTLLVLIGTYLYWKKSYSYSTPVWKDPIVLLFIAAILIQLISWYFATQNHPEWANSSPKVHRMGIWFKMIPIAIILGGHTDRILLCWLLALAALLSAPFISGGGLGDWQTGLRGGRIDFGINNAQHTAMLAGVLFLSLLAALATPLNFSFSARCWLYALLASLLCTTLAVVIFTQTRVVWLGLIASTPLLLLAIWLTSKQRLLVVIGKSLAGILVIIVALTAFQDIFKHRAGSLAQNFESVKNINQMLMKDNSFVLRLSTWEESLNWIDKRPLFGWGGDAEKHIVAAVATRLEKTIPFRHLHNAYLETLANYGIVGLMVLLLLCAYLVFCAYRSWRSNTMPTPIYLFLIGFLPFWLIINISESYFYYSSGEYILAIVGGVILSYYWKSKSRKPIKH